ncbi:hypothetical protein F5Y08DRAFT_341093 [Xylaria arbuscula]|uniref:Uncharacterized protein n=1 Tax=Xylaria arbuscula TaxID=114810 RepID=A0A9W8NAI3_9PEZI|nr:hypothetical protein F5Y08DRAFT_341093 [Xylaria arbuscula]KAJ3565016.1 hypothetical protein NPX13_g7649 [Xylaria arbuscula]
MTKHRDSKGKSRRSSHRDDGYDPVYNYSYASSHHHHSSTKHSGHNHSGYHDQDLYARREAEWAAQERERQREQEKWEKQRSEEIEARKAAEERKWDEDAVKVERVRDPETGKWRRRVYRYIPADSGNSNSHHSYHNHYQSQYYGTQDHGGHRDRYYY